jgi:hypothetical protein
MSSIFPNGTVFSISTALAAGVPMTALSNAADAVATITGGDLASGDIVLIKSAWPAVNERVVRLSSVADGQATLDGLDTTDEDLNPPNEGAGTLVKVSAFVAMSQATEVSKSGGEQQYYQYQYLEDRNNRQRQKPTFKNAKAITLTLDYDPTLPWYAALTRASEVGDPVVLRAVLPGGVKFYYWVYPSFDPDPSMSLNQNMQNTATFSLISDLTRYED